ncbi:MAG: thioredoxin-dependent thiol peroxidase [Pseudomonadaceae bacterium]|nr:thioredoxin-dependent thiol peroxidase [Pseudomonadaceae bacterium]
MLNVGDVAPDFRLKNQNNQLISLGQYKGKWIITYFYPKALTSGCTVQACAVRDHKNDWAGLNAVVLGISPDKPELLKKFERAENLNFQLLSDSEHKAAEAYGVWQEKSMYGRTYMGMVRSTFIIGPDGLVAKVFPKVTPKTHADEVMDWLKEHQ